MVGDAEVYGTVELSSSCSKIFIRILRTSGDDKSNWESGVECRGK